MAEGRFISYYRVSTGQQGQSGLGLDAQRSAVATYLNGGGWKLIAEFTEVESGKRNDRPQLAAALAACRAHRATLVIAKLDRLARNTQFLLSIVEGSGDGGVVFCDLPQIPSGATGKFLVTLLAAVAELEAGLISARTKAALAAAKARGKCLGNPRNLTAEGRARGSAAGNAAKSAKAIQRALDVAETVSAIRAAGHTTLRSIAAELNAREIPAPRGGTWASAQVLAVLRRLPVEKIAAGQTLGQTGG